MGKLQWLWDHRVAIGAALVPIYVAVASFIIRYIPRPEPTASWWKRALFDLLLDNPASHAPPGRVGIFGGRLNLPGLPSRLPGDNPTPAVTRMLRVRAAHVSTFGPGEDTKTAIQAPKGSGGSGGGTISQSWRGDDDSGGGTLLLLALGFAGMLLAGAGCATAVKQTVVAEDGLARAVSIGYRTFDKYDAGKMAAIDAKAVSGDQAQVKQARADLEEYKPKKTKAMAALDTAADLVEAADKARQAVELGVGNPKNFTTYLPLLVGALLDLKQALADVGGLL